MLLPGAEGCGFAIELKFSLCNSLGLILSLKPKGREGRRKEGEVKKEGGGGKRTGGRGKELTDHSNVNFTDHYFIKCISSQSCFSSFILNS